MLPVHRSADLESTFTVGECRQPRSHLCLGKTATQGDLVLSTSGYILTYLLTYLLIYRRPNGWPIWTKLGIRIHVYPGGISGKSRLK